MGVWGHERMEEPGGCLGERHPSSSPGSVLSLGGTYLVLSPAGPSCRAGPALSLELWRLTASVMARLGLEEEVGLGSPLGILKGDFHPGTSRYGGARWLRTVSSFLFFIFLFSCACS